VLLHRVYPTLSSLEDKPPAWPDTPHRLDNHRLVGHAIAGSEMILRQFLFTIEKSVEFRRAQIFVWAWLCFAKIPLLWIERGNVIYG
jgi:hypothetical protein